MPKERVLAEGKVERVGTDRAIYHFSKPSGFRIFRENLSIPPYTEGIQTFLNDLLDREHGELAELAELGGSASRQCYPKAITASTS